MIDEKKETHSLSLGVQQVQWQLLSVSNPSIYEWKWLTGS